MLAFDEDEEKGSWLKRNRALIAGIAVFGSLGGGFWFVMGNLDGAKPAPKQIQQVTLFKPPPPPPPPPPPKVEEKKIVEEKKVFEPELQKIKPPDDVIKPDDAPPPLGLDAVGTGPGDGFGLVGNPGGRHLGEGGTGSGSGGGTRFGWYSSIIQSSIQEALQRHERIKRAAYRPTVVKLWIDPSGRITRAELVNSTGDKELDDALTGEVLTRITLRPPPQDMPQPLVIRTSARPPRSG